MFGARRLLKGLPRVVAGGCEKAAAVLMRGLLREDLSDVCPRGMLEGGGASRAPRSDEM